MQGSAGHTSFVTLEQVVTLSKAQLFASPTLHPEDSADTFGQNVVPVLDA